MRASRSVAVALALVLVGASCFGGDRTRDPNVMEVTRVDGEVSIREGADTSWKRAAVGGTVAAGSGVRVPSGASIVLARGEKSSVELRASESRGEIEVRAIGGVGVPATVEVRSGDVLVVTDPSAPIEIVSHGTTARALGGVFRFDRRLRLRIGSYDGSVKVSSGASDLPELPTLDELLVNPRVPAVRQPYTLDEEDPWDKRLLADAIELQAQLEPLTEGYEGRFGARTRALTELDALRRDAGRDLGFAGAYLARTPSGDLLVGVTLALMLELRGEGSVAANFLRLIERRRQGAGWGLIAHAERLPVAEVVRSVACAISLRTGEARPGTSCFRSEVVPPTVSPSARPTRTTSSPPRTTRPTVSPTPTRTRPPSPSPSPTRSPSPSPSPSSSPSPTPPPCSDIDRLLGRC